MSLSQQIGHLQAQVAAHEEDIKALETKVDAHHVDLKTQLDRMERKEIEQRGFIAGVVFIAGCIGALVGVFKEYLISLVIK